MPADLGPIDRLVERADTLAGAWGARARTSTTVGQERALLRLFGVSGLDREGRPLAGEVVDRYLAGGAGRLSGGVILPFVVALLEYELAPQPLALEVAAGTIDLGLEAELLHDAGRRSAAEAEASRLAAAAWARIDANRTARRELLDVLGDAPTPWVGAPILEADVASAVAALGASIRAGADLIQVTVPVGRELASRLHDAGIATPGQSQAAAEDLDPPPAGSQRGLALLRRAADVAAAERREYVRLATVAPGLAAPEQAVVAAFERVDVASSDAVAEILDGRVDPDRALADHAFAHRLYRRAGSLVVVGAGPLVVAPDLALGLPSSPLTRAGRALALQALGVALARREGLGPDEVVAGALPGWLIDEFDPAALAIAQVAVRRAVFADHPLCFSEPAHAADARSAGASTYWGAIVAGALPFAGRTAFIIREGSSAMENIAATRTAATIAADVADSIDATALRGAALEHARGTVEAALQTMERLADEGWRAVLGERLDGSARDRLGADAVVERIEAFDPFA